MRLHSLAHSQSRLVALIHVCLFVALGSLTAHAATPGIINYQGRVQSNGVDFTGTGQFRFALVNGAGTQTLWSNDGSSTTGNQPTNAVSLTVTKGLYAVILGDTTLTNMTTIPTNVFSANSDVRLRVWFNDGTNGVQLLSPDQRITSVGYAMVAGSADSLTTPLTLSGDVTGTTSATVVSSVGGMSALNVAQGAGTANFATNANNASTIVKRDAIGNFSAGTIAANLLGNVTGNVSGSAGSVSGIVAIANGGTGFATQNFVDLSSNQTSIGGTKNFTGNVGLGTSSSPALLDLSSTVQTKERLRLSGNDYANDGNLASGISFLLQRNLTNRSDLFIGQSAGLTSNTTNAGIRLVPAGIQGGPVGDISAIDAISTDGTTFKDLHLNNALRIAGASGNVGIGFAVNALNPPHKLDVHSTTGATIAVGDIFNGGGGTGNPPLLYMFTDNTNAYSGLHERSGKDFVFLNTANGNGAVNEYMRIKAGGNVGIGTTSPLQKLDVTGATYPQMRIGVAPAAFAVKALNMGFNNALGTIGGGCIQPEEQSNFYRDLYLCPFDVINSHVAIGQTTAPSHLLTVNGICRSTSASFVTSSDRRVKEHIEPVSGSLDRLLKLRPVTFDYTAEFRTGRSGLDKQQTGFIAQEVQTVFPEMVSQNTEKVGSREIKDFHVLNTSNLTPHLVAAVQELKHRHDTEVKSLQSENATLKAQLEAQQKRLAELEAKDKAREARLARIEKALGDDEPKAVNTRFEAK